MGVSAESSVAMDADGDFVISWTSRYNAIFFDVLARRYAADGIAQGTEFRVNTYTTNNQSTSSVALDDDGDFVIAWKSEKYGGPSAASQGQDGSASGVYAQRFTADGTLQGAEFQVNTYTTNDQEFPSIALDGDGDFVIAWKSDGQDGSDSGVFAQRFQGGATPPVDTDGDNVLDANDNCTLIANAGQRDTNNDGFGNRCDPDVNNDGIVNAGDLALMKAVFYSTNADADLNGDGRVNVADLAIMKSLFNQPPGPSGTAP